MTMTFEKRNLENIAKLADHTKAAALKWHKYLAANKIDVLIYETIRSVETQRANVRKGASKTMRSYHLVGQALDFVPIIQGEADWAGYNSPAMKKAIKEAKRLGFTWGADWDNDGQTSDEKFIDSPHLQFAYKGYGTDTFGEWTEPKSKPEPKYPGYPLKERSTNTVDTQRIQKKLKIKTDGVFGPKTKAAVKAFQKERGLKVDGIVGEKTWKVMF